MSDSLTIWWVLLFFVLTSPFLPLTGIPISYVNLTLLDWQRLFEGGILVVSMVMTLIFAPRISSLTPKDYYWGAIMFLLGLVSAVFSAQHLSFALLDWSWLLLLAILMVSLKAWQPADRHLLDQTIQWVVLISCIAYLWEFWRLNAFIYFEPLPDGVIRKINFFGFANVRFFSDYQSFMLLLLPTAMHRIVPQGPIKAIGLGLVALYFTLAFIAGSRGLIMAHVILHGAMLMIFGKRYWPYLSEQLRYWAYGYLIFLCLTQLIPLFFPQESAQLSVSSLERYDASGRDILWGVALNLIKAHPFLGVGPMHFANTPNAIASSPHNFPMQMAVEWGIPAAIIFCWVACRYLHKSVMILKALSKDIDAMQFAMFCAGAAVLLQSLVACSPLGYPISQIIALICFSYPLAPLSMPPRSTQATPSNTLHLAGIAAALVIAMTITPVKSIRERNQCFHNNPWPTSQFATHFWQQGWIFPPCGGEDSILTGLLGR